ncbi:TonB family protein [Mucilaginibacter sp.]|uniref:TonB family protein n=1 Tax=Mucilaginibacter sp. TaxID=1882438 RepID=UPI0035BC48D9
MRKPVNNKRTEISQIQKYLKGELDTDAMHRLEREAQHDPLLMDAMDGYEQAGRDQQDSLDNLQGRLQQRVAGKQARVMPMWYWAAAASVLLVVGIGTYLYRNHVDSQPVLTAQADKTIVKPVTPTAPFKAAKTDTNIIALQQPKLSHHDPGKSPLLARNKKAVFVSPLNEYDIPGELPVRWTVVQPQVIAASPAKLTAKADKADTATDLSDVIMAGLASEKVAIDTGNKYQVTLNSRVKGVQTNPNYNALKQPVIVQGVIIGKDDGLPIPGVNIRVLGTTTGTVTDVNGKFALSAAKDKTVSVASLGYESKQVNFKGKDSVRIALKPSSSALNEVVVANSGNLNRALPQHNARPQTGWKDYKKYLVANSIVTDGQEGTVKLQFTVSQYGQISDIRIIKSLDAASDTKAVELIKNGPGWQGNTNKKPEVVKIKVEFKKQHSD